MANFTKNRPADVERHIAERDAAIRAAQEHMTAERRGPRVEAATEPQPALKRPVLRRIDR